MVGVEIGFAAQVEFLIEKQIAVEMEILFKRLSQIDIETIKKPSMNRETLGKW